MEANEEMVRAAWILVHRCDGSYRGYVRDTVLLQDKHGHWLDFPSWAAAAEFTRERQEQIRQLREEIDIVQFVIGSYVSHVGDAWQRILFRLEAELAKLTADMKEGA